MKSVKTNWKKEFFSTRYDLFANIQQVGELEEGVLSLSSSGKLNDCKLRFQKKRFLGTDAYIVDAISDKRIGEIKFNFLGHKAEVKIKDKTYDWKFDNFWGTKWSISENYNCLISYNSSAFSFSGDVKSTEENDMLLLTGLFAYNHFSQIILAIVLFYLIFIS